MLLFYLIDERFIDQYHLFYGDNLSHMCFYEACLSSRQLSILKKYD